MRDDNSQKIYFPLKKGFSTMPVHFLFYIPSLMVENIRILLSGKNVSKSFFLTSQHLKILLNCRP